MDSGCAHGWQGNTTDKRLDFDFGSAWQLIRGIALPSVGIILFWFRPQAGLGVSWFLPCQTDENHEKPIAAFGRNQESPPLRNG